MSICKAKAIFLGGILFSLLSTNSYAQHYGNKFQLTDSAANMFSIDRIGQQVYFSYYGGVVDKLDLKGGIVTSTSLIGIPPIFGNKRHIMLDVDTLFNLDNGTSYVITPRDSSGNTYWTFGPSFSPNDSNLTVSWTYPNSLSLNFVFSLRDSSLTPIDTNAIPYWGGTDESSPQWSSDTSIVFAAGSSAIAEYSIESRRIDTLVHLTGNASITSFSYNVEHDILAYGVAPYAPEYTAKIFLHRRDSSTDIIAFSDSADLCHGQFVLRSLSWSPEGDKLGFFTFLNTNPGAGVYFYSIDSNRTYEATICWDEVYKYYLQWLNEDTLFYINHTDPPYVYGMDTSPAIDAIQKKKDEPIATDFSISSYPNPFNPNTKITVTLPGRSNGLLSIYDVQGRLVKGFRIENNGASIYSVTWNAVNNGSEVVASGFYLAVLRIDDPKNQNRKVIKLIYLK